MARSSPSGVLPVLATPFTADGEVDGAALAALVDWQYRQGADGVTLAMVSEILRMTHDERQEVAEAVIAGNAGRGCVVISVGAESTVLAVRLARHAERAGADALMAIPPVTAAIGDEEQFGYFAAIADVCGLPLIVQDASAYVGTPMSIALQSRLLDRFGPDKVLFKPEAAPLGPRLTELMEATGGHARAFEGSGGIALLDTHARGLAGTMPGPDVTWAIVALWQALEKGDLARADEINGALTPLLTLIPGLDGYVAQEKYLLTRQGVLGAAHVRGPVSYRLDEHTRVLVDRLFDRLAAITGGAR
ncbi:dihydrodipicolinate synthase family protein [Spongiactinospora sp. TRM90649]|uniref:dihydrodipicolinate synthase family protein n=1 Tax=Spongiactinospora sp. TRM90649 TaxID=3031114 RepID=UPI0023F9FE0B|nr:dihydrodipicolinate synthase family protein [Spongiactinospora sp. TRM90649]MDF5757033.1 dihydrodipicolinate synthase family protein [Spongiactinospora sp. TRM90649]